MTKVEVLTVPDTPEETIRRFIDQAEQQDVTNSTELQKIYTPGVVEAIGSVILSSGSRPRVVHPESADSRRLVIKSGRKKVLGEADLNEDGELKTIYLAEHKKLILKYRRKRWAVLAGNGSLFSSASDGPDFFMPSSASEEAIATYKDKIGETIIYSEPGGPESGLEMAGKAVRERQKVMNGFLQTVASLTKELISVQT